MFVYADAMLVILLIDALRDRTIVISKLHLMLWSVRTVGYEGG